LRIFGNFTMFGNRYCCRPISHFKSLSLTRWCYPSLQLLSWVVYYIPILFRHLSDPIHAGYDPFLRIYGNFTMFGNRYCCRPISHLKSLSLTRWCYPSLQLLSGVVYYIPILFGHLSDPILPSYDPILWIYGNFTMFGNRYCCRPVSHFNSLSLTRWCYPTLQLLSGVVYYIPILFGHFSYPILARQWSYFENLR
jgi:hypothetical protein